MEPFNKVIISKYIGLSKVTYYELALKGAISLRSLYEMGLKWFLCGYIINLFSIPSYYIFMGLNNVNLCFYTASLRFLFIVVLYYSLLPWVF